MNSFHYREEMPRRSRLLTAQMAVVLIAFIVISVALIIQGHPTAGISLLVMTALITTIDGLRIMRLRKATGCWEIAIDGESFRWSSPNPSLGPTIEIPIKVIKSLVVTNFAWSEVGSDKRYQLVLVDGSHKQLWGWDRAPMDRIMECLKSNGVTSVRKND